MPGFPSAPSVQTVTDKLASLAAPDNPGNVAGYYVYLRDPLIPETIYESATTTDSGGNWSITGVPAGTYQYAFGIHPNTRYRFQGTYLVALNPPTSVLNLPNLRRDFAAVGGGVVDQNCAITNAQAALSTTSSPGPFTVAMVGKNIWVKGAGAAGGILATTILSFTDSQHITLAANAQTTVTSGGFIAIGVDDTTAITNWLGAGLSLYADASVYLTTGFSLAANSQNYQKLIGAGMGATVFACIGSGDLCTLAAGGLVPSLQALTLDGNGSAAHCLYAPDTGGIQFRHYDLELINAQGTPGYGFENANRCYSGRWFGGRITNNNVGVRLIKQAQNTHFIGVLNFSNKNGGYIFGDDSAVMSGPITVTRGDAEHTASQSAQDNIQVNGVQPLIVDGVYFEGHFAGSSDIHIKGTHPSAVLVRGVFGAGAAAVPNPILIDAGATGSTVSLDGYQFNGYTGTDPVLDNSAGSVWGVGAGLFNGGLYNARLSGILTIVNRLLVSPPSGAAAPLERINAPSGFTGDILAVLLNAANRLEITDQGLLTITTPGNAGGVRQNNPNGSGIAYWINQQGFGHNFQGPSSLDLFRIDQKGHLQSPFSGTPASSALGANVTSVTPTGNDVMGSIAIVMSGALAANTKIATITWANTLGTSAPRGIALINQTSGAGLAVVNFYATPSTGVSYDLFCNQALAAGTYTLVYFTVGAMAS